jgi:hypothetical protein
VKAGTLVLFRRAVPRYQGCMRMQHTKFHFTPSMPLLEAAALLILIVASQWR